MRVMASLAWGGNVSKAAWRNRRQHALLMPPVLEGLARFRREAVVRAQCRRVAPHVMDEIVVDVLVLVELLEAGFLVEKFRKEVVCDPHLLEHEIESGALGDDHRVVLGEKVIQQHCRNVVARERRWSDLQDNVVSAKCFASLRQTTHGRSKGPRERERTKPGGDKVEDRLQKDKVSWIGR